MRLDETEAGLLACGKRMRRVWWEFPRVGELDLDVRLPNGPMPLDRIARTPGMCNLKDSTNSRLSGQIVWRKIKQENRGHR